MSEALWIPPLILHSLRGKPNYGPVSGPPALVIPGFLSDDRMTRLLREELGRSGWRSKGWGLGVNRGATAHLLENLERQLREIDRPFLLVGWSLGGLYARELARNCPDLVTAVVTLGSPFAGDIRANNAWRLYEMVSGHSVDEPPVSHQSRKPPVPTLAIWSRRDGIVARRSAQGIDGERDFAVEIDATHIEMGASRRAVRRIAFEIKSFTDKL